MCLFLRYLLVAENLYVKCYAIYTPGASFSDHQKKPLVIRIKPGFTALMELHLNTH